MVAWVATDYDLIYKNTNASSTSTLQKQECVFVCQVSLCAGCNAVHPNGAFVIGIIAGITFVAWSTVMLRVRVDDPLDAVAGK